MDGLRAEETAFQASGVELPPTQTTSNDHTRLRAQCNSVEEAWRSTCDHSSGFHSDTNISLNALSLSSVSTRASSKGSVAQSHHPRHNPLSKVFCDMSEPRTHGAEALAVLPKPTFPIKNEAEAMAFAQSGPLFTKLQRASVPPAADWLRLGAVVVADVLGVSDATQGLQFVLDRDVAVRVYHLYLPIYFWMRTIVREAAAARVSRGDATRRALAIGISAPQGCGKTTLVTALTKMFAADDLGCAHVSIDDFYLSGAEQDVVASRHASNSILQVRGNAGTHDILLGEGTLRALLDGDHGEVPVPVYDKAARGGRGDRAPTSCWRTVLTPCDVILLEGWMSGFKPHGDASEADLASIHPALPEIDAALACYGAWDALMDAWCVLGLEDKTQVFEWRLEAERKMAAAGRPGMSDEQVRDFVARYMPAYRAYCPRLYADATSGGVDGKPTLMVHMDGSRKPVG